MRDRPPQDALYNLGGKCTSQFLLGDDAPLQLVLRDASGAIIGSQSLADFGGGFTRRYGCYWTVSFDEVPISDFYSATLTAYDVDYDGTSSDGNTRVYIDL